MNLTTPELIVAIVVAVAVLLIVAAVVVAVRRKRRRDRLEHRYGREVYARAVARAGDERRAEERLEARAARRASFEVHELSSGDRSSLRGRFEAIQASFVDGPDAAVRAADELLDEVAEMRGFPAATRDDRLEDLAVDHPASVDRYRSSRARPDHDGGSVTTEQHRQALIGGRALFESVVGQDPADHTTGSLAFRDIIGERDRAPNGNGHRRHEPVR